MSTGVEKGCLAAGRLGFIKMQSDSTIGGRSMCKESSFWDKRAKGHPRHNIQLALIFIGCK
jgi:hypothetical protein